MHNHHDTYRRFPPGCADDKTPFGIHPTGAGWGSSWKVYLLPFVEQANIYNKWVFDGTNSGYVNANNMALVHNVTIPAYRCPSTVFPDYYSNMANGGPPYNEMFTCYVGITGAVGSILPSGYPDPNVASGHGPAAASNCLYAKSSVNMARLTDGTSNTMMIGEQSDHLRDALNAPIQGPWGPITSQGPHGWAMGAGGGGVGITYGERTFNCVTIRWSINQKGLGNSSANGTHDNTGNNIPLSSLHPGGCCVTLADASTRFMSQTTPLDTTLKQLACGNDGNVVALD